MRPARYAVAVPGIPVWRYQLSPGQNELLLRIGGCPNAAESATGVVETEGLHFSGLFRDRPGVNYSLRSQAFGTGMNLRQYGILYFPLTVPA